MAHVNARQWQRFAYRADVQLRWDTPQCDPDVQGGGVCVNLGRGGMQVRADAAPDVGAAVSCKLWFAGDWTMLPGFVRWTRNDPRSERSKELGIEFGPLSPEQTESIGDLVASAEHGGRHVRLRVPGLRDPLEALAVPTDRGLRVRAPLRLFASGCELDVELPDASLRFAGRVVGAQLRARAGNEHWELELLIEECEAPRSRRYTMHGATRRSGFTAGAAGAPSRSGRAEGKLRSRLDTLVLRRSSEFSQARWLAMVVAFAIAALGTATFVIAAPRRTSQHLAKSVQALPPTAVKADAAPTPDAQKTQRADRTLIAAPGSATVPDSHASDAVAAPPEAALNADQVQFVADDPSIEVNSDRTQLFVPMRGALERARSAVWVDPYALVIDLPDTEVTLARSRYVLHSGGVRVLSVGTNHGVTQLRLFLDAPLTRYSTEPTPGGLAIYLKRDLHPML